MWVTKPNLVEQRKTISTKDLYQKGIGKSMWSNESRSKIWWGKKWKESVIITDNKASQTESNACTTCALPIFWACFTLTGLCTSTNKAWNPEVSDEEVDT